MPTTIDLRLDFSAANLRCLARRSEDAAQARRLLALAVIYDSGTCSEASIAGQRDAADGQGRGATLQRWGAECLLDRKAAGSKPLLTQAHRQALAVQIAHGPIPAAPRGPSVTPLSQPCSAACVRPQVSATIAPVPMERTLF